ncbi:alpha/beta fold hydrolase [Streptomyces sp. NPDC050095]|uniref:esterase/lipase family protein n=1 Tax=unclassified Streptomyces TaxID=2593676 RepID=UPI0034448C3D
MRSVLRHAAAVLVAGALTLGSAGAASAAPTVSADPVADAKKLATPRLPGVNDWSCKPSAAHPRPVILVHGTFDSGRVWRETAPDYTKAGYCVFALDYGKTGGLLSLVVGGIGRIADSAKQLRVFVDGVLAATGTDQVDIVGHSQGGMMPRQYMKFEGGATKVHTLVGISPSNHGTGKNDFAATILEDNPELQSLLDAFTALVPIGAFVDIPCPACTDQTYGSPFLKKLNAGGDTLPGVHYTVIVTDKDKVVVPPKGQFLTGENVDNILLQNVCPANKAQHSNSVSDPVATRLALNALDPEHPVKPTCPSLTNSILDLLD